MRVGVVILPDGGGPEALHRWRRAEELGFDHAWTYDHLAWRSLRDDPWFSAVPTLTAAAMTTRRLRLGPLVASPNFRHPVPFARELITLDDLSQGRLTVGLGAGGTGWDATMLGGAAWSPAERADRFEEFVALTDRLLREPATTYRGRHYSADEARTYPGCVQRPRAPFAVAGIGARARRVAARYGQAWVTAGPRAAAGPLDVSASVDVLAGQQAAVDAACADVGRDPTTLDRLVLTGVGFESALGSVDAFAEQTERFAAVGITDLVVHWPRATPPFATDPATFERIFTR